MTRVEAPGKLNLSLLVGPPRSDGYHPLDSLVQTLAWCDLLEIEEIDEAVDTMTVDGSDMVDPGDNLVLRALSEARRDLAIPTVRMRLEKDLPVAAGLGGGSSDAAALILVAGQLAGVDRGALPAIATRVGADVPLFLTGGSLMMGGVGDVITPLEPLEGFAVAVAVPPFGLSTVEVYRRWDQLGGPEGDLFPEREAPPALRGGIPLRNDLLPAAISVEPLLGDFIADLRKVWGVPVSLTGSGSACFAYFTTVDEAIGAATSAALLCSVARGVGLRRHGVAVI